MDRSRLLLVEEDSSLKFFVKNFFESRNFIIDICSDGEQAIKISKSNNFDIAIIDTVLPKFNGITVLRRFKERQALCPVIMLSDSSNESTTIESYKSGANLLHSKPINYKVLEVQVNSLVKTNTHSQIIEVADIFISPKARLCIKNNKEIYLTLNEFNLLCLMFFNRDKIFSREEILSKILTENAGLGAVDTLVSRLRCKLGMYKDRSCIETVVKSGFRISSEYRD